MAPQPPDSFKTAGYTRGAGTKDDAPRAVVVCPYPKHGAPARDMLAYKEEETVSLAHTLGLETVARETLLLSRPSPSLLIGGGAADRIAETAEEADAELCVFGCLLTPIQQRNLEKRLNMKVIDRTALILEIFAARATTKEGTLQTELAAQEYLRTRLVRSWTHLERQRGGRGFLAGPGESQIESDRRAIRERIASIKKKLEKAVTTRRLHRKKRKEIPYKIVALAGYTNAGKSTLFNALTQADAPAEDKLFATLDPKIRPVRLPGGRVIMLADTVGFISDLPAELVAAFRATLEEVSEADLVLHVRDAASPMAQEHKADVEETLAGLIDEETRASGVVEIMNKADLLERPPVNDGAFPVHVSAINGAGLDSLKEAIEAHFAGGDTAFRARVPQEEGKLIAFIHDTAVVKELRYEDGYAVIRAVAGEKALARLQKRLGQAMTLL